MREVVDTLKKYGLILMVSVLPIMWPFVHGMSLRTFQESAFQMGAFSFLALFFENIWLTLFMIWNVFLFMYHGASTGSAQVVNILLGCLIYRFAFGYFKKRTAEILFKPIIYMMGVSLIFLVLQMFGIDMLNMPQDSGANAMDGALKLPIGLFGISMAHGIFLAMCMPIIAATWRYGWVGALALLYPIYLTRSSAAMLGAIAVIVFYVYHNYRRWFLYLVAVGVLAGSFFVLHDYQSDKLTMKSRWPIWSLSLKLGLQNQLGYGPDSYRNYNKHKDFLIFSDNDYNALVMRDKPEGKLFTYYSPTNDTKWVQAANAKMTAMSKNDVVSLSQWDNPHCLPITILFDYGLLGIAVALGLLITMWRRFQASKKTKELVTVTGCFIVLLVGCTTQFPLHLARLAIFFPIFLGVFYALTETKEGERNGYRF